MLSRKNPYDEALTRKNIDLATVNSAPPIVVYAPVSITPGSRTRPM